MKHLIGFLAVVALVACARSATAPLESCKLWQATPQTIPNSQQTNIVLDVGTCPGAVSTAAGLTLPTGRWLVLAQIVWAVNGTGGRGICLYQGDSLITQDGSLAFAGSGTTADLTAAIVVQAGDTFRLTGTQTSGGNLATMAGQPTLTSLQLVPL